MKLYDMSFAQPILCKEIQTQYLHPFYTCSNINHDELLQLSKIYSKISPIIFLINQQTTFYVPEIQ